jgi:hypothetical protein
MKDLRGGDQWYQARSLSRCYQAAVIVHRLGIAGSDDVARACAISRIKAYEALIACTRRPHLYHIQRMGGGKFSTMK